MRINFPVLCVIQNQVVEAIYKGMSLASNVAGDLEEMDHSDMQEDLEMAVKQCIDLEHLITAQKATFQRLQTEVYQQREIGDGMAKYDDFMVEAKLKYDNLTESEKYFDHEKYKEFKQLVWVSRWRVSIILIPMPDLDYEQTKKEGGDDDDNEVVIAATKKSVKCPLTTTWLEEPVTSKLCKHTFSKNAIYGLIRRSREKMVECPMPGCRKSLTESIFYEDTIMERMVTRAKEVEGLDDRSQFHDVE
ncbi:unnamed protein product [Absidia cylindrospora]